MTTSWCIQTKGDPVPENFLIDVCIINGEWRVCFQYFSHPLKFSNRSLDKLGPKKVKYKSNGLSASNSNWYIITGFTGKEILEFIKKYKSIGYQT